MHTNDIKKIIESVLPAATAHVFDPLSDGQHFQVTVISPAFDGLPLFKQHQLVMKALKEALKEKIHAVELKTFTPQRWKETNG